MNVRARRFAEITAFAQRLKPTEVAQYWFRRGRDFARDIHATHPTFPKPGPDGLYLAEQVRIWFDGWHGRDQNFSAEHTGEEEALEIARNGRRRGSASSN